VQEGQLHGVPRRGSGTGVALRRGEELRDRLRDAEEHQVDADAGREQHGRPTHPVELRPGVVGAEPDAAEARQGDADDERQIGRHGDEVEPAEGRRDPAERGADDGVRRCGGEQGPERKRADADGRDPEDDRVDAPGGGAQTLALKPCCSSRHSSTSSRS
jgi:hypothetical protein